MDHTMARANWLSAVTPIATKAGAVGLSALCQKRTSTVLLIAAGGAVIATR